MVAFFSTYTHWQSQSFTNTHIPRDDFMCNFICALRQKPRALYNHEAAGWIVHWAPGIGPSWDSWHYHTSHLVCQSPVLVTVHIRSWSLVNWARILFRLLLVISEELPWLQSPEEFQQVSRQLWWKHSISGLPLQDVPSTFSVGSYFKVWHNIFRRFFIHSNFP